MFGCMHKWSFPRRRAQFGSEHDVDVQTCTECGAQRKSTVQFGRAAMPRPRREPARLVVLPVPVGKGA